MPESEFMASSQKHRQIMAKNDNLHKAKRAKADEFYTQLSDIENECQHYWEHFKGKTILCNCDDPRVSNFFRYFSLNFEHLGLKKLIATCYKSNQIEKFSEQNSERAVYIEYEGDKNGNRQVDNNELEVKELQGDGDFRSKECIELLKEADIVVTNPPFSLFREYVAQLIEYEKKFLIIGNLNAISYKEIFPLIKQNKIWLGYNSGSRKFEVPIAKAEEDENFTSDAVGYICTFFPSKDINCTSESPFQGVNTTAAHSPSLEIVRAEICFHASKS